VAVFPHQATDTPHSTEAIPRSGSITLLFEQGLGAPKRVQGVVQASPDPECACRGPQDVRLAGAVSGLAVGPAGTGEQTQGPPVIPHGPKTHPETDLGIGLIGRAVEDGGHCQGLLIGLLRFSEIAEQPQAVALSEKALEESLWVAGPPEERYGVAIACEGLGKHAGPSLLLSPNKEGR
jgi:hypothetical protein